MIFCRRNTDTATSAQIELGSTIQTANTEANNGIQWLPYILINTQGKSTANEVLLHEMIHAAYGANQPNKPRDPHDPDPGSCFLPIRHRRQCPQPERQAHSHAPSKHADVLRKRLFLRLRALSRLERRPNDWDHQLAVSFRRKPESITTGDGGMEPISPPSASMDPGLRRDDNEMVRQGYLT